MEPNVKLDCVSRFCYLGDTLGRRWKYGGGSESQSEMCLGQVQEVILHFESP